MEYIVEYSQARLCNSCGGIVTERTGFYKYAHNGRCTNLECQKFFCMNKFRLLDLVP